MRWLAIPLALTFRVSGQAPKSHTAAEAHAFLTLLSDSQKKQALFPAGSDKVMDWHYVPRTRPGIPWASLNAEQKKAGHILLSASLSKAGYVKVEALRALEPVLREIENGNPGRDLENYSFVFFGEPSDTKAWAWRYEGHHISLTFAYRDGALISSSPQFLGSNPAEVQSGPKKGTRVLSKEQDLGFKLVESFSPAQMSKVRVGNEAPGDIVTSNARHAAIEGHKGLPFGEMSDSQKKLLLELLHAHAEVQSDKEQARRFRMIEKEELRDLVFVWMGPVEKRSRHYYRIQGKNLLVEYDNTQSDGNHIHTVWRNLKEDFGEDPLMEHYTRGHHRHSSGR